MKHVPIIFPLSFLVLLVVIFASGTYAIAEVAVTNNTDISSTSKAPTNGYDWYQSAAILICPIH
jgi:hypothetical protein